MQFELMQKGEKEITVKVELDAESMERAIVSAYREISDVCTSPEDIGLLSTAALVQRNPKATAIVRTAVQREFESGYGNLVDELGVVPNSEPYIQPLSGDVGEKFELMVKIPVTGSDQRLVFENLRASYMEVYADGTEVDARIRAAKEYYGVSTDEELIAKTKYYEDVDSMREALAESLRKLVDQMNTEARKEAAVKALLKANPIDVPEADIESYVSNEMHKMEAQVGEAVFAEQVKANPGGLESLKQKVRADVGYIPHLNLILSAIAARIHFEVDDSDRLKEIESERDQSIDPDSAQSAEEILASLADEPEVTQSLGQKVRMDKALEYVISKTQFSVSGQISFKERLPHGIG